MKPYNQMLSNTNRPLAQTGELQTLSVIAKNRILSKYAMSQQAWEAYDAEVSISLLTLRTAFPTQVRNYSDRECDMLTALWLEIFVEVERGIIQEAIMRFVAADRKGFFPSPGQVMGIVEEIQAEQKKKEAEEYNKKHNEFLFELQERIDNGENCSTCRYCVSRESINKFDHRKTRTRLFCQNPDSYKYEGKHSQGTSASIICACYEK